MTPFGSTDRDGDREVSEPGIVGRLVVVVVAAIAVITLLGWISFGVADGLFDDDDDPCEGVDCPATTLVEEGIDTTLPETTVDPAVTPTEDSTDGAPDGATDQAP